MTANEQLSEEYYEDIVDRHLRNERNVADIRHDWRAQKGAAG